jgi:hypothetical protein
MIAIAISSQQCRNYRKDTGSLACWAWAVEQFGNPGHRWQFDTQRTFLFRDEKDAVWFSLKWL